MHKSPQLSYPSTAVQPVLHDANKLPVAELIVVVLVEDPEDSADQVGGQFDASGHVHRSGKFLCRWHIITCVLPMLTVSNISIKLWILAIMWIVLWYHPPKHCCSPATLHDSPDLRPTKHLCDMSDQGHEAPSEGLIYALSGSKLFWWHHHHIRLVNLMLWLVKGAIL